MMILTPDQARAVIDGTALFVPADEPDAWPVGEDIDVRARRYERTELDDGSVINSTVQPSVAHVRLGEPVPVFDECPDFDPADHVCRCYIDGLTWHRPHDLDLDQTEISITRLLGLWPDAAWQPATWAFPITERSTT